ncbi:MAG: hypothetical protein L3J49_09910 [Desulfobulbaceae bacterium]|nr:hypothetical protein [Desulfobulbaceae bacterium]
MTELPWYTELRYNDVKIQKPSSPQSFGRGSSDERSVARGTIAQISTRKTTIIFFVVETTESSGQRSDVIPVAGLDHIPQMTRFKIKKIKIKKTGRADPDDRTEKT